MKTWSIVLAVMAAFVLSLSIAQAAEKVAPLKGTITKIDGVNVTLKAKDGTETTFATNDSTVVKIKGETKAVSDLAVGKKATVILDADGKIATAITSGKAPATAPAATNP